MSNEGKVKVIVRAGRTVEERYRVYSGGQVLYVRAKAVPKLEASGRVRRVD